MAAKATGVLLETSVLEPALGNSTPRHVAHLREVVENAPWFTSVYIRKEFVRRWFCDLVRFALTIAQCGGVADAISLLSQDFGRGPKGTLSAVARYLREVGSLDDTAGAAEEVASLAYRTLLLFDRVFPKRTANDCGCQIGDRSPPPDCDYLLDNLQRFYREFVVPVVNCPVNRFLDLGNAGGRASAIIGHERAGKLNSVQKLGQYAAAGTTISCRECAGVGDAMIALEQPGELCLVHLDAAFGTLCPALGKEHRPIKSLVAVEKEGEGGVRKNGAAKATPADGR